MEYLITYFILGLIVSIGISEIDKIKVEGSEAEILNNMDRLLYIVIWPLMIYWIVKGFIISDTTNKRS
jgi:hypothetical protein